MTSQSDELNDFEELLIHAEDGTLNDTDAERLREILRTNESARRRYVQIQMLNAAMSLEGDIALPLTPDAASVSASSLQPETQRDQSGDFQNNRVVKKTSWPLVAATIVGCLLAGRWLYLESTSSTKSPAVLETPKEATSQGIALLTRLVDVVWDSADQTQEVGDALGPGRVAIKSGFVQIEFFCGATVVIEGPADFELKSAKLAKLRSGQLRAEVPPAARGFSIDVDDMTVVDLGTEFGLSVGSDGTTVQVFDGEVEVHQPGAAKKRLTTGQAVARAGGQLVGATSTPDDFTGIADLRSRSHNQTVERFEKWKAFSDKLRTDKRLITYYAFDHQSSRNRRLMNSQTPHNSELDGAIVGARRTSGRWSDSGALEFKRPADRVRVQVPGEFDALTLACWVRIDSLDRWYNSLFLTDGYEQGEPHWQILDTGQLFFSTRARADNDTGPHHKKVLSPPFWNPSMSGKWLHLATSFNPTEKRVTHYLNGKVLSEETIPDRQLVKTIRIGTASIGNWAAPTKPDEVFAIRNLNGRIDEFAMFNAALSSDEIEAMYQNGKP